jgi:tetratricopeptide (TPR) repeat protein
MALGFKPLIIVALCAVPLLALELLLGPTLARRLVRLDAALIPQLGVGAPEDLLARLSGDGLLAFFAPRHEIWRRAGLIWARAGNHDRAAAILREAFDDAPYTQAEAIGLLLGQALEEGQHVAQAEGVYRQILARHPSARAAGRLGILLGRMDERLHEAEAFLLRALESGATRVDAATGDDAAEEAAVHAQLAKVLIERGQLADGQEHLRLAKQHDGALGAAAPVLALLAAAEAALARARGNAGNPLDEAQRHEL